MNAERETRNTAGGVATRPELCPSCERFIGPVDACPYCGTDSGKSPVIRFLRYGSLLLAIGGLCFLYLMTASRRPPLTLIGDITPMMNFAHVRIEGTVEKDAYIGRKNDRPDYLSFVVDDGTGRARVSAYDRAARGLIESGRAPQRGERMAVSGTLNVSASGMPRLRVVAEKQLSVVGQQMTEYPVRLRRTNTQSQ